MKKLIETGKERGFVTYDDLNKALPPDDVSSEQIEDTMTQLSELGINVVDNEETDDGGAEEGKAVTSGKSANEENQDLGRTDDPVRMYLREMGSVELLSREGEIAIAKRIEAGREKNDIRDLRVASYFSRDLVMARGPEERGNVAS